MSSRWAILAAVLLLTVIPASPALAASQTKASGSHHVLAQSDKASPTSDKSPAKDAATPVAKESGPPWTFQMARIIIVLSILLVLAIFRWYWKLVGSRAKGTA